VTVYPFRGGDKMIELFHPDSKFMGILNKIADMMLLNVLFMITSIPIFTLGASITALYTVTLKLSKKEEIYPLREYLTAFKTNFKKATFLWLILFIVGGVLTAETWFLILVDLEIKNFFLIVQGGLLLFYLSTLITAFPLLSNFSDGAIKTLNHAVTIPFNWFPESMVLVAINILPIVLTGFVFMLFPSIIMLWGFIGFASVAYLSSFILNRIFQKMTQELS
jgi:uncharacterized membrane protein YesL